MPAAVASRFQAIVLGLLVSLVGASRYEFLELRLPSPSESGNATPAPFHLVFPDTLGPVAVRAFLESSPDQAKAMLSGPALHGRPLTRGERHFLSGLRAMTDGRPGDAHGEFAAGAKGLSPRLKDCLRIDAALLLYLSGMPDEAEKEWRRALRTVSMGVKDRGAPLAGAVHTEGAAPETGAAPNERAVHEEGAASQEGAAPQEGAWRNLYSLYLNRRNFSRAHQLVDEALQSSPGNRWAQMAKGFLLRMLGTPEDWEGYLRNKSSWKDSLHGIQIAYGKFLADQEQWEEAVKYYNRGLEGAPANGPAWLELADAYYRIGYLVFAEQCIQRAFHHGISNPYVYELYANILVEFSSLADTGGVLSGLGFRLDTSWASRQWLRAERIVEEGFPKALESRSMAQLLYRLYCRNGRVEAANNLRSDFWFHFAGPALPARPPRLGPAPRRVEPGLRSTLSYVTYPLVRKLQIGDFFDFF